MKMLAPLPNVGYHKVFFCDWGCAVGFNLCYVAKASSELRRVQFDLDQFCYSQEADVEIEISGFWLAEGD